MSRKHSFWSTVVAHLRIPRAERQRGMTHGAHERRLRLEPLEDRRLLAVFTVDNLNDAGAGSLRQAIEGANAAAGADTIEFQAGLSGTIALSSGQMQINDELTIDGPGDDVITIDAQQNSRIFHITEESGPVRFEGLSLSGGRIESIENANGGAILSETSALVTISSSSISDNSTSGIAAGARGGGLYVSGDVMVAGSSISGNSASGDQFIRGGAIYAFGDVTVSRSVISDNSAVGVGNVPHAGGGGISAEGDLAVTDSTISGNFAGGAGTASGGGLQADGDITITGSILSGNTAAALFIGAGGGLAGSTSRVTVKNSTVSGNTATGAMFITYGGGIHVNADLTVINSTIANNLASGVRTIGGGIRASDDLTIENAILAGNVTTDGTFPDLQIGTGPLTVRYSLIGDNTDTGLAEAPAGMPDANGNLIGDPAGAGIIDPMLGPLGDNGGPTFTHALLPGSPAIDAGDPAFAPPPFMDQRGFVRVADGGGGVKRIDMGAYEFASALAGDGNGDGFVGPQDYTVWANNFGISGEDIPGDYNGDGIVGPQDYTIWANNHGNTGPPPHEVTVSLGATGSASASGARTANLQQDHRPGEPAQQDAHAAAIQESTAKTDADAWLSYVDRFWALMNAGLISFGDDDVIGDDHHASGR